MNKRSVIVYIATSVDGYIAGPNDDLSFLSAVQKEGEDYGYYRFIESVDTVIIGRKTYDWVLRQVDTFPHADKETFVITRTEKPSIGKTVFYNGALRPLVETLKTRDGKTIFVDGGAEVVDAMLRERLVDELIVSVIPVLLGSGTRLFKENGTQQPLELLSSKAFESGLVQLHYRMIS